MSRLFAFIATLVFTVAVLVVCAATVFSASPVNVTVSPEIVNVTVEQEGAPAITVTTTAGEVMNIVTAGEQGIPGQKGADSTVPGPPGADGHSPVLTWSGDQIAVDGTVTGPHLTGQPGSNGTNGTNGADGHSPVLTWSGDQIAVDGAVTGPHLTGQPGANGTNGTNGADGHSPVLTWSGDQIAVDGAITGPHLTGQTGADGADGARGFDGREVEVQNNGTFIQWRYVNDTAWRNLIALSAITGVNGINGTNGKTVLSGSGAPSNSLGTDGDFYLDTPVSYLYGPKTAGAWGAYVDLVGPQGPPGPSASVTQTAVLSALDDPTDGAVLYVQQGPTEAATAAKMAVGDRPGNYKWWVDSNGTSVRQCITGDTAPAVKMLAPTGGTVLYSVACNGTMTFTGTVTIK